MNMDDNHHKNKFLLKLKNHNCNSSCIYLKYGIADIVLVNVSDMTCAGDGFN